MYRSRKKFIKFIGLVCSVTLPALFIYELKVLYSLHLASNLPQIDYIIDGHTEINKIDWTRIRNKSEYELIQEKLHLKNSSRSRAHWCEFRNHMKKPQLILQNDFGYKQTVNAEAGEAWDMIFGGYPHCGERSWQRTPMYAFDWKMERGLNDYLNKKGWDKLQPHQVWFPCMGCRSSYCNKRDLCYLTRKIDPTSCYILPDDRDRLLEVMNRTKENFWVVKQDSPTSHLHLGTGVRFIKSQEELPTEQQQELGTYLVQPIAQLKMGSDDYRRRHDLRMYLSVTSTTPLRAYVYSSSIIGRFANVAVNDSNPLDICSLDIHGNNHARNLGCPINEEYSHTRYFDYVANKLGLNVTERHSFITKTNQLLASILLQAQPKIQDHIVNKGIIKSGATCFSFLRVDFAMTDTLMPFIYEINEFPFANEHEKPFATVQENAYRDLFKMIGLDQPPLVASERRDYEMAYLGNWTPLVIDDVIYSSE